LPNNNNEFGLIIPKLRECTFFYLLGPTIRARPTMGTSLATEQYIQMEDNASSLSAIEISNTR